MSVELHRAGGSQIWELVLSGRSAGKPPLMDHGFLDALEGAVTLCEAAGPQLKVVLLRSAETRFFCVGADVNALQNLSSDTIGRWVERGHKVLNRLESLGVPVVAAVNGFCMGGGLELAMACDLIVAGEEARFAQSEARLGFVTGWGGAARLRDRIGRGRAARLLFSGAVIDAEDAFSMGLVDVLASPGKFEEKLAELTASILENSSGALASMKKLLNSGLGASEPIYLDLESQHSIQSVQDPDTKARVAAFLKLRASRAVRPASVTN